VLILDRLRNLQREAGILQKRRRGQRNVARIQIIPLMESDFLNFLFTIKLNINGSNIFLPGGKKRFTMEGYEKKDL
jgi:hypothetical protein